MKFFKPRIWKFYSFLFSAPLVALAVNLIMFGERLWQDPKVWLISVPLVLSISLVSWYAHVLLDRLIEWRFPGLPQSRQGFPFCEERRHWLSPRVVKVRLKAYEKSRRGRRRRLELVAPMEQRRAYIVSTLSGCSGDAGCRCERSLPDWDWQFPSRLLLLLLKQQVSRPIPRQLASRRARPAMPRRARAPATFISRGSRESPPAISTTSCSRSEIRGANIRR